MGPGAVLFLSHQLQQFGCMEYIKRSEAIKQIKTGAAFDMEFVTADEKRGTGGDLIAVQGWQITTRDKAGNRVKTTGEFSSKGDTRNPNHDLHGTLNIHNPGNRHHPITVHTILIQSLNGKRILNG